MEKSVRLGSLLSIMAILFVFTVSPVTAANHAFAANSFPTGITTFTQEKLYVPGQTVNVLGQIHSFVSANNIMMINIYTPDSELYLAGRPYIGSAFFDFSFPLDKQASPGQWKVIVRYAGDEAQTSFKVLTNGLDKALLGKPVLLNGQGNEMALGELKAKKQITITADLESDQDSHQQYVFIVQVSDIHGKPIFSSLVLGSMSPFQTVNPYINWTPATSGTYTINIMTWSALSNPVPLTEKQSSTFEVHA